MNIVCIGAHPDDCEVFAGGVCIKWARLGNRVTLVSLTNGDVGHFSMAGGALAQRRIQEAQMSAERDGMTSIVLDHHDGELMPTLELRKEVVRLIRNAKADIVLTHRPNDYHPDHRYTSIVVQDAAFVVTVPLFCPDIAALSKNPVFLYMMDTFQKPSPFQADIAVDVSDVMDSKWDMLDVMESQMYEWLPWLDGTLASVPAGAKERREWLRKTWTSFFHGFTIQGKKGLEKWYGKRKAAMIEFAELFEISEYGHQPSKEEICRLFPFFGKKG